MEIRQVFLVVEMQIHELTVEHSDRQIRSVHNYLNFMRFMQRTLNKEKAIFMNY